MSGERRGEALMLAERTRRRIEGIRGLDYRIAPALDLQPEAPKPLPVRKSGNEELLRRAGIGLGGVVLLFVLYKTHLWWSLGQLQEMVSR